MAYYGKKYLSLLLTIALINSSIQPLYASFPEQENDVIREAKAQARMMVVEEALQAKIKTTASFIESLTPSFIKKAVLKLGTWVESTLKDLPDSYFAKSPLEIDYGHNKGFWLAHFSSAVDEIKDVGLSNNALQVRLAELQDMVMQGVLSPYAYEKGLQDLQGSKLGHQALFEAVREEFKDALKCAPGFVDQTFRHEASLYIQDLLAGRGDAQEFISHIRYYRDLDSALDYKDTLTSIRSYLRENKKALKITKKEYGDILNCLNTELERAPKAEKKGLKANQAFSVVASSELPYYRQEWDELSKPTNNALAASSKEKGVFRDYLGNSAKALCKLVHTGAKYAQEHPGPSLMIVLASQVVAAAALKSFSVPGASKGTTRQTRSAFLNKEETTQPTFSMFQRAAKRNIGGEFPISENTTAQQQYPNPAITILSNNNFFVAWSGNQTGDLDIYGRVFSINGSFLSNELTINQNRISDQIDPAMTTLSNGNAFVAWSNIMDYDVYGRVFFPNGTALSNEFKVNQNTAGIQGGVSIASLNNGNALVSWYSYTTNGNIYGRLFFPNGTASSNDFQIDQNSGLYQFASISKRLESGNVFVAWLSGQPADYNIYGRVLFPNGTALSNDFLINQNTTSNQYISSVTSLKNGNSFVTWYGDQTGNTDSYGRVFFPNGIALGNEFKINQNTTGTQNYPSLIVLNDGNTFVVWDSDQNGNYNIYGRVFSPYGFALSEEFPITQNTVNNITSILPVGADIDNNAAIIIWQSSINGAADIYGRILGPFIGNEFEISQDATSWQMLPAITSLNSTTLFATWYGNQTGNYNIYGRSFSANGLPLNNVFTVNQNTTVNPGRSSVATLNNGNAFVAWHGQQAGNNDIYGRVFFPNGTALNNEFGINYNTTADQLYPAVMGLNNGDVFATWYGFQSGIGELYGRVLSASGVGINNEVGISQNASLSNPYSYSPAIALLNDSNIFVAWYGDPDGNYDLFGRVLSPNGTALTNEFIINQNTTGDQSSPAVAALSNGNAFVVWHGNQNGVNNYNIYGRIFAGNGTALNNEFMINQNAAGSQSDPSIVSLEDGNVCVVWGGNQRTLSNNYDLYGRVFFSNGTALNSTFGINQNTIFGQYYPSIRNLGNGNIFVAWEHGQSTIYGRVLTPTLFPDLKTNITTSTTGTITTSSTTSNTSLQGTTGTIGTTSTTAIVTTGTTGTTGRITTGPLMATTGHSTTEIPVTTYSVASSSHSDGTINTIIGASVGGGIVLIGGTALGALLYKKHKRAKQSSAIFSPSNPQSSTHASVNMLELNDRSSIEPESSFSTSQKGSAFSPTATGIEAARIRIKGQLHHNNYERLTDINRTLAKTIDEQTGVEIAFAPGEKKKKDFALGRGRFGKFMIARNIDREPKQIVGVKQVKGDREIKDSLKEGEIQSQFNHPNVMPLLDYINYQSDNSYEEEALEPALYQFMPLAGFGDGVFFQKKLALMKNTPLANKQGQVFSYVAEGLLKGLSYMHSLNYYHLDFKNTNFVITKDGTPQIIDFGCTQHCPAPDKYNRGIGDARYYSLGRINFARFVQGIEHDEKANSYSPAATDAWALGVTLLEMWYNNFPFETLSASLIFASWDKKYFEGKLALVEGIQAPNEGSMMHLIKRMVILDDKDRIRVSEALKHPVFKNKANTLNSEEDRIKLFKELKALSETGNRINIDINNNYVVTIPSESSEIREKYYQPNKNYN